MRTLILAVVLALGLATPAAAQFEWPVSDPTRIPDVRIAPYVDAARDDAREAGQRAREGEAAAGQARRLVGLRSAVGRGPKPITVADSVVRSAVEYDGFLKGSLTWETGAVFTGDLSGMTGVSEPEPESALSAFSGTMYGAWPMTGVFTFRNGDEFRGRYNAGSNASGIFTEAGSQRRFIGIIDFEAGGYRPLRGYVVDRRGQLLAVVSVR